MRNARTGTSAIFIVLLVASAALNVLLLSGCGILDGIRGSGAEESSRTRGAGIYDASADLREIAENLGIDVEGKATSEIASDIRTKIYVDVSGRGFPRVLLTEMQLDEVNEQLPEDKREIIAGYQQFIKSLEGKRFVVVP